MGKNDELGIGLGPVSIKLPGGFAGLLCVIVLCLTLFGICVKWAQMSCLAAILALLVLASDAYIIKRVYLGCGKMPRVPKLVPVIGAALVYAVYLLPFIVVVQAVLHACHVIP